MTRLIAIALALAPAVAQAQFLPTGMESMPSGKFRGFFPNDPNTVLHFTASNLKPGSATLQPIVGPALTVNGAPTLGAGSCRYTKDIESISDANYISHAAGAGNVTAFSGDFSVCTAFVPTSDTTDVMILVGQGAFGASGAGWSIVINNTGAGIVDFETYGAGSAAKTVNAGAFVASQTNVVCAGRVGTTIFASINGGALSFAAGAPVATPSTVALNIGRSPNATGFSFRGTVLEFWASTTPPPQGIVYAPSTLSSCAGIGSPLVSLTSANVDGSNDGSLTNGSLIASWRNAGTAGNFTQTHGTIDQPVFRAGPYADGKGAVGYDGVFGAVTLPSSTSIFPTAFDAFFLYRNVFPFRHWLMMSGQSSAEAGFAIKVDDSGHLVAAVNNSGSVAATLTSTATETLGPWQMVEVRSDGAHIQISHDLSTYETGAWGSGFPTASTNNWMLGTNSDPAVGPNYGQGDHTSNSWNGVFQGDILDARVYPRMLTGSEVALLKAAYLARAPAGSPTIITALGDSTTQIGGAANTWGWPMQIQLDHGPTLMVSNVGVGGERTAGMLDHWTNHVRGHAGSAIAVMGGVNDVQFDGLGAAAIESNLQTIYDQAQADGLTLVVMTILPWKNSSLWTAGGQTITDTVNTWIRSYQGAHPVVKLVDGYALLGGQGGDPAVMLTTYDSTDHLHPNMAGNQVLATAVETALGL